MFTQVGEKRGGEFCWVEERGFTASSSEKIKPIFTDTKASDLEVKAVASGGSAQLSSDEDVSAGSAW